MAETDSLRKRRTSALLTTSNSNVNGAISFPAQRSPIPRPTSLASVQSTTYSETDHSEILSPTPRRHYLLQQQFSSQWLQSPSTSNFNPTTSRPSSPLNPHYQHDDIRSSHSSNYNAQPSHSGHSGHTSHRRHKHTLSFSSLAEGARGDSRSRKHSARIGKSKSKPTESLSRRFIRWMDRANMTSYITPTILLITIFIKWAVGLGSYSGYNTPPMYGDYEAQRHWLEITYQLPLKQWYWYDLPYWGLDYPPLTAYVSWVCGCVANLINPSWVALDESRGIETPTSKIYMRSTVLLLDILIYIPAIEQLISSTHSSSSSPSSSYAYSLLHHRSGRAKAAFLLTVLLQPALILIDNGHFQYNSVMLGLAVLAFNFFSRGWDLAGAIAFVASLGFKQMALYYSPAVFAYLFGKCLLWGWRKGLLHLIRIGAITVLSFVVLFLPFIFPLTWPPEHLLQPIIRIFPFARGLFEDKVANFWCASNVFIKWHKYVPTTLLPKLATLLTAFFFLPTMWALLAPGVTGFGCLDVASAASGADKPQSDSQDHQSGNEKPHLSVDTTGKNKMSNPSNSPARPAPTIGLLPYALFNSSMAFFLFSFQVHEKSILVPLMPLTLLMASSAPEIEGGEWEWGVLVNNVACFSMWPLLKKDGLVIQYLALLLLWNYIIGHNPFRQTKLKHLTLLTYSTIAFLHMAETIYTPPKRYPDLFPVLNAVVCASIFGLSYLWSVKRLVEMSWAMGVLSKSKTSTSSSQLNTGIPSNEGAPGSAITSAHNQGSLRGNQGSTRSHGSYGSQGASSHLRVTSISGTNSMSNPSIRKRIPSSFGPPHDNANTGNGGTVDLTNDAAVTSS